VLTDLDFTADFAGNAGPPSPGPAGVALSDAQQKRRVRFFMTSIRARRYGRFRLALATPFTLFGAHLRPAGCD
jgi:hypothetical protein